MKRILLPAALLLVSGGLHASAPRGILNVGNPEELAEMKRTPFPPSEIAQEYYQEITDQIYL